jgi:hypothetical protein
MEIARETGLPAGACWCVNATFTQDLLQRVPEEARNKACVCAACAALGHPAS